MPTVPIDIPSFMGGVSRLPQSQRSPIEVESMDNCDIDVGRGTDKRAGTEHIAGAGDSEEISNIGWDTGDDIHVAWLNRASDERFMIVINDDVTSNADLIAVIDILTGDEVTVHALASDGSEVALNDLDADVAAMVAYIKNGTQTMQQRLRTLSVEDGTFILNRTVATAFEGSAITYTNSGGNVRSQSNTQNVVAWSDFDHPPSNTATYPTRATLVSGGTINDDAIWYAREDDVGLSQGFYWAISGTQPPWFQRLPTEEANSFIKRDTMPLLLEYTGTKFLLKFVDWEPRKSGDSTTNPGPSFIGQALSDISFHQGRLWFSSKERVVSSRAADIFNLWIESVNLVTDADPIDDSIQGTRVSDINFMETFHESLILMTGGARQVELRANGPITPQSYQLINSTDVFNVDYVEPVRRGSQLYFAGERDASMVLWEYDYSASAVSNTARDLTARVHGYIPAEAFWLTASNTHGQLFCLTRADEDAIYVNKVIEEGEQRLLSSWYRWVYPGVLKIHGCEVFDDHLYMLVERERSDEMANLLYLERQALGKPLQENDGTNTLGYALRMDRKKLIQGTYNPTTGNTTFDLNVSNPPGSELHVVTGPSWDTDTVKAAGTEITDFTVTAIGSPAVLVRVTVPGDLENNADGDNAPCYIGTKFSAEVELSEIFVRDGDGRVANGINKIMSMWLRHVDTGGYSVEITPKGRSTLTKTFVVPTTGSTPADGDQIESFGEFQVRVMSSARGLTIKLINDTPFPTAWVDADFTSTFVRTNSPIK